MIEKNRFVLVDCNNFYVSCERVFNPTLLGKPVVVLSSNDACVIARSNEAKKLGIGMGEPAFECAEIFKKYNVIVYSANFALYGDMSARVMKTLTNCAGDIEIYSVDEAFLFFPLQKSDTDYQAYAQIVRQQVKQHTGIPVSIGIGPTKTLAKIANWFAKKFPHYQGFFDITNYAHYNELLANVAIADVWGIGYRYARMLRRYGIENVLQFIDLDEAWVRKHMTVNGLKTLLELKGISCLSLQEVPSTKKSITVSRSFGRIVTEFDELYEAVAAYMACAAEKLRTQQVVAGYVTVFVVTMQYHDGYQRFYDAASYQLPVATSYTPLLIHAAHYCLKQLFKKGLRYKKAGVILDDFSSQSVIQLSMLQRLGDREKEKTIMRAVDTINNRWGRNTVSFASAGIEQPWKMRQLKKSPCYTTNWHELLKI